MQLVDELSMIYTTCLMCYATFSLGMSRTFRTILGLSMVALAVYITFYYHYLQDPKFHQRAYAILTAVIVIRSMYLMQAHLGSNLQRNIQASTEVQNGDIANPKGIAKPAHIKRRDAAILKTMWIMVTFGVSMFVGGFGIWSLDNIYCSQLRKLRRQVGLPWGILLEGHGWW